MESILSAVIAGAVTLIGVLIANSRSQAVTDTKLEELTREVREHNNYLISLILAEKSVVYEYACELFADCLGKECCKH